MAPRPHSLDNFNKNSNLLFQKANFSNKREPLLEYFSHLIKGFDQNLINSKELAYSVAGALSIDLISNDPVLSRLVVEAGELELPDDHISGDFTSRFNSFLEQLRALV